MKDNFSSAHYDSIIKTSLSRKRISKNVDFRNRNSRKLFWQ